MKDVKIFVFCICLVRDQILMIKTEIHRRHFLMIAVLNNAKILRLYLTRFNNGVKIENFKFHYILFFRY